MLSVLPPGKARSGKLQVRRPSNSISYHSMLQALLLYVFSIYIFIVLDIIINIYFFSGECWRFFLCLWTFLHTCRRVGFFCCACVICLPIARCTTLLCSVAQHCLHVGALKYQNTRLILIILQHLHRKWYVVVFVLILHMETLFWKYIVFSLYFSNNKIQIINESNYAASFCTGGSFYSNVSAPSFY